MAETLSGISTVNDRGAINLDPHGDGISSFTQVFPTGELWGVNERAFTSDQANRIVAIAVEKLFVATLENYLNVYRDDFSFTPPFTLEMGATGLAGKVLSLPSLTIRGANDTYGPIRTDSFSHTYQLDTYDRTEWIGVLREFFIELYDLASISRADALQDQHVAAHGLPPR